MDELGVNNSDYFDIKINSIIIKKVIKIKILGIILDTQLTFKYHISYIKQRINYIYYNIKNKLFFIEKHKN